MTIKTTNLIILSFCFNLLFLNSTSSFAQGKILVHEFKLLNDSPESLPDYGNFLGDSAFISPILEVLERGIRSKVGDLPIDYYSGRQIDVVSAVVNPYGDPKIHAKEQATKFMAYYTRFKKENRKSHQYIVTVHTEFLKPFIWHNQENVKFKLHVKIKETGRGKIFSEGESYTFVVNNPDTVLNEQANHHFALYQNFPLNKSEIQKAYINGLEQVLFGKISPKIQSVNRSVYEGYNDFIHHAARKYSLTVPTTYGYSTLSNVKYKVLGITVMAGKSKHSAMVAGELSENRKGLVHMSEKRLSGLTDLDFTFPLSNRYRQFTRDLTLSSELFPSPYKNYTLKGSIQEVYTFGFRINRTYANTFKLDLYDENKELKSDMLVYDLGAARHDEGVDESNLSLGLIGIAERTKREGSKNLQKILRNYGRIYTPYIKTEGKMLGKQFALITNPSCLNNVEIYYGNEMVGLITHSKPTKKQLKKKKNFIPHMLYLKGGLTAEEEALIMQNFQLMRVGYAMNSLQRSER